MIASGYDKESRSHPHGRFVPPRSVPSENTRDQISRNQVYILNLKQKNLFLWLIYPAQKKTVCSIFIPVETTTDPAR